MPQKRTVKIYVHHKVFIELPVQLQAHKELRNGLYGAASFSSRVIFGICYRVGKVLIWPIKKINQQPRKPNNKGPRIVSKSYFELNKTKSYRFGLAIYVLLIIISVTGLESMNLFGNGLKLKGQVLGTVDQGLANLKEAQALLGQQKTDLAQQKFAEALQSFTKGQTDLNDTNIFLKGLLQVLPQKRGADRLLEAAGAISSAGISLTQFYQDISNFKLSPEGLSDKNGKPPEFQKLTNELAAAVSKIDAAFSNLNEVDQNIIPAAQRNGYLAAKEKFAQLAFALHSFRDTFNLLSALLSGDKQVLLVFENNNELRPTGGFMGTYGLAKLSNGQIKSLKISSIYDLDGQLQQLITPPHPIFAVNNRWFLRDSNWFTSFPESAQKITSFFEKEGGGTPDLVIALTPDLITDLLKITGPIDMPKYNVTLNADNFVETTQVVTSLNYDKTINQPKQMLADFFPSLLQRLSELTSENAFGTLQVLEHNLQAKQILFYAKDKDLQNQLTNFNWTGVLKATDRDYLAVSTANYGGTKTDLFIDQKVNLKTTLNNQTGNITNTLTITRTNRLPDLPSMKNLSFIRIYVPLGATLTDTNGFEKMEFNPGTQNANFRSDPDIVTWEKNAKTDPESGMLTGLESGKTIFGNWLELKGGETKTITLQYQLPFYLNQIDKYSLLLQKQPGARAGEFSFTLQYPGQTLLWKNFDTTNSTINSLESTNTLNKDYLFGVVLKQP